MIEAFKNLKQLEQAFKTNEDCLKYYESIRWIGGRYCPHCAHEKHYELAKRFQYKCANKECHKQFNVMTRTVFENTKLPLPVWFTAIYIATSHKKGISSIQLSKDIGVCQTTAWFMLQRIREMMRDKVFEILSNEVEVDETYIGGKEKNKHLSKRIKGTHGRSVKTKTPVFGMLQRKGRVMLRPVPRTNSATLHPIMEQSITKGSTIYTDDWEAYCKLNSEYKHEVIKHSVKEYVNGRCHTNGVEGFWSLLKRGILGIYHQVSPKHLHRYCDEFGFRYNTRQYSECDRFEIALFQGEGRLKYFEFSRKVA